MGVTRVTPTSQSPQYASHPPGSPLGAPIERDAHPQSLFYILLRVPSKGALPSQSPRYTSPPPGSPIRAPFGRDAHLQSLFYLPSSQRPQYTSPPPGSPIRAPSGRDANLQSLFYLHPLKVPGIRALLQVPQLEPLLKEMLISRAFSTNS
jgi:hypothetical protein